MKKYAAILAGGSGLRLGGDIPKQFLMLGDRPIIQWSVDTFSACREIDGIVITCPKNEIERTRILFDSSRYSKILAIVAGGQTRQDSSRQALNALNCSENDIILIHDAARPFIREQIILDAISVAAKDGACGIYIPVTDTVTEIQNGHITDIPERKNLYSAQTPQAFKAGVIKQSHMLAEEQNLQATDDITLVLAMGHSVSAVDGDSMNIKITDKFDYEKAKWMTTLFLH